VISSAASSGSSSSVATAFAGDPPKNVSMSFRIAVPRADVELTLDE